MCRHLCLHCTHCSTAHLSLLTALVALQSTALLVLHCNKGKGRNRQTPNAAYPCKGYKTA